MTFGHTPALVRSVLLAALIGVLAVAAGRPDVVVLAVPFVVYAAWALAARTGQAPTARARHKALAVPEGESVGIGLDVTHSWRAAVVAVQWPVTEGVPLDPEAGTVIDLAGSGSAEVVMEPQRWGRYRVGPAEVQVTDLSGAWRAVDAVGPVDLAVRPASTTLEGGSGVSHPIGIVGAHRSLRRGEGGDLADVREFRPGDRLRRINWRVTSRLGAVHVNSTLTERDTDVLVVADTLVDIAPADPDAPTSLDATVRAVAAISRHYVGFGDRVAVHDLGRRIGHVRSGSGPRQAKIVLNVLSRTRRQAPEWDRIRPLGSVTPGTLVFFCSPLLDRESQDELVRLRRLGAEVIGVDTLPEGVGEFADIASFRRDTYLGEAWMVRRMERDAVLARLRTLGIPVVPWRGTGSLAAVLLAMEAARTAPRRVSGR